MPIPYDVPPPHPNADGWLWLLIEVLEVNVTATVMMIPYITNSDPLVGSFPSDYLFPFITKWMPKLRDWLPSNCGVESFGFYWGTSRGVQRTNYFTGAVFNLGLQPGNNAPSQIQGLIKKTTATWPNGRPRLYVPYPPLGDLDANGNLLPAALTRLAQIAHILIEPVICPGLAFSAASYATTGNFFDPVLGYQTKQYTGRMMRRSPLRAKGNTRIVSQNWNF